ncbi:MAG: T9SS type A sorting domain-containing protein [Candidatus Cloacimonetes bacterium]|nr:T9SS type A sorting domain-containing protein [Candidatus Cloacimonadota bacterium]
MKIRIILLFLIIFTAEIYAQESWVHTYDPFDEYNEAIFSVEDVVIMSDGCYAVNGTAINTETTIGWGFVIKVSQEGELLWAKRDEVSFQYENAGQAIVAADDGGIISASHHYLLDSILIKRDSDGNREWVESYSNYNDLRIESLDNTNDGNYIITGAQAFNNYETSHACIAKISDTGDVLWINDFYIENTLWTAGKAIISTNDGGYLITGYAVLDENMINDAVLVIKTDAAGDSIWTRYLNLTPDRDNGHTIVETLEGDILVGGYTRAGVTRDGFIWKLDSEGNTIWVEEGYENCGYMYSSFAITNDDQVLSIFSNLVYHDSLRKFDFEHNEDWTVFLPYHSAGDGDKVIRTTPEGNIIVGLLKYSNSTVGITKLNPDGTEINDETITILPGNFVAYPNPFNPEIRFSFSCENNNLVELHIYNIKGQIVSNHDYNAVRGQNIISWKANGLPSGNYFAELIKSNKQHIVKKIILMK